MAMISTWFRSGIALRPPGKLRDRDAALRTCVWSGTEGCRILRPDREPSDFSYLETALSPDGFDPR